MIFTIITDEIVNTIADEIVKQVFEDKNPHIVEYWMLPDKDKVFKTFKDCNTQAEDYSKPDENAICIERISGRMAYDIGTYECKEGDDKKEAVKKYVINDIQRGRAMSEYFLKNYDSPSFD